MFADAASNVQSVVAEKPAESIEQRIAKLHESRDPLAAIREIRTDLENFLSHLDIEQGMLELVNDSTIDLALRVAESEYAKEKHEQLVAGRSLPQKPSIDAVKKALQNEKVQAEIRRRTEPKLRFELVDANGTLRWRVLVFDGPKEMPLEQYSDSNLNARNMTREQRILASRGEHKHSGVIVELNDDMTLYDLLAQGAYLEGDPIDQSTWSLLSAKFNKGNKFVRIAFCRDDRSHCGKDYADYMVGDGRLRFAVRGDVIF